MSKTKIPWADKTYNPIYGCFHVSTGCRACYAERMAARQKAMAMAKLLRCKSSGASANYNDVITDGKWNGQVAIDLDVMSKPLYWTKPARIFVCAMSDLFYEGVPDEWIEWVFETIGRCQRHTFLVLTKRAKRMREFMESHPQYAYNNLWLGVTCENQEQANERIPHLLATPAAHRFVSVEPMLGPVDLHLCPHDEDILKDEQGEIDEPFPMACGPCSSNKHWCYFTEGSWCIDHAIAGCESGPGRRPMDLDWARDLRDQCATADVPFMLKQAEIDGKLVKMPKLDGKVHDAQIG